MHIYISIHICICIIEREILYNMKDFMVVDDDLLITYTYYIYIYSHIYIYISYVCVTLRLWLVDWLHDGGLLQHDSYWHNTGWLIGYIITSYLHDNCKMMVCWLLKRLVGDISHGSPLPSKPPRPPPRTVWAGTLAALRAERPEGCAALHGVVPTDVAMEGRWARLTEDYWQSPMI